MRAYKNSCYRVRRCSRPLCSSQRTTRHRPPDPTRPTPTLKRHSGMRYRPALQRSTNPRSPGTARSLRTQQRAYDPDARSDPVPHAHPRTGRRRTRGRPRPRSRIARSLRTQQRAYEPVTRHPDSGPRTPRRTCSTGSPRRGPAELVSVPPSSTVSNTRDHPVVGGHHGPSTALDHQHQAGGQRSLERR